MKPPGPSYSHSSSTGLTTTKHFLWVVASFLSVLVRVYPIKNWPEGVLLFKLEEYATYLGAALVEPAFVLAGYTGRAIIGRLTSSLFTFSTTFDLAIVRDRNNMGCFFRDYKLNGAVTVEKFGIKQWDVVKKTKKDLRSVWDL